VNLNYGLPPKPQQAQRLGDQNLFLLGKGGRQVFLKPELDFHEVSCRSRSWLQSNITRHRDLGLYNHTAGRAALYALELTPGSVSMEGVWQMAASFDTARGMVVTTLDLALFSDVSLQQADAARPSLLDAVQGNSERVSVGFVDIEIWRLPLEVCDHVPGRMSLVATQTSIELWRRSHRECQ
jgi:hypothetical protein